MKALDELLESSYEKFRDWAMPEFLDTSVREFAIQYGLKAQVKAMVLDMRGRFEEMQDTYHELPKWRWLKRLFLEMKIQVYRETYQECFMAYLGGGMAGALEDRS